jgi:hypothetical protein
VQARRSQQDGTTITTTTIITTLKLAFQEWERRAAWLRGRSAFGATLSLCVF